MAAARPTAEAANSTQDKQDDRLEPVLAENLKALARPPVHDRPSSLS